MARAPKQSARPKGKTKGKPRPAGGELPTKEQIIEFIQSSGQKVGKREITRAFSIKGGARIALKRLLAEMVEEGTLAGRRKDLRQRGALPPVTVLEVTGRDDDGDLVARPLAWDEEDGERPSVLLLLHLPAGRGAEQAAEIGIGDRVLARITRLDEADAEGYR